MLEVLISSSLMLLIVGMVGGAMVMAARSKADSETKIHDWRVASIATERLRRELSTCVRLYAPDPTYPMTNFTPLDTAPLRFFRNGEAGPVEVSYWFDPERRELKRLRTGDPAGIQVVARGVREFRLDHEPGKMLIRTRVFVNRVQDPILAEGWALSL